MASLIAGCALAASPDIPGTLEKLADSPSRVVLYSLSPRSDEGTPPDQTFHTYTIRGRADVTDPKERQALLRALAKGARDATPNMMGACFNPRHGLRVEQGSYAADFVICFECLQVQSCGFQPAEDFLTSAEPQSTFDESLRHHNLPLPEK
jgi:hypothetical protein